MGGHVHVSHMQGGGSLSVYLSGPTLGRHLFLREDQSAGTQLNENVTIGLGHRVIWIRS